MEPFDRDVITAIQEDIGAFNDMMQAFKVDVQSDVRSIQSTLFQIHDDIKTQTLSNETAQQSKLLNTIGRSIFGS